VSQPTIMRNPFQLKKAARTMTKTSDLTEEFIANKKMVLGEKINKLRALRLNASKTVLKLAKRIAADTKTLMELEEALDDEKIKIFVGGEDLDDDDYEQKAKKAKKSAFLDVSFQLHGGSLADQMEHIDNPEMPGFEDMHNTAEGLIKHCEKLDESSELPEEAYTIRRALSDDGIEQQ